VLLRGIKKNYKAMDNRLRRSNKDFWLGGVCGGIAEYFEFEHTILIRLLFVMLFISPAVPSILIYLILWIIIKEKKQHEKN